MGINNYESSRDRQLADDRFSDEQRDRARGDLMAEVFSSGSFGSSSRRQEDSARDKALAKTWEGAQNIKYWKARHREERILREYLKRGGELDEYQCATNQQLWEDSIEFLREQKARLDEYVRMGGKTDHCNRPLDEHLWGRCDGRDGDRCLVIDEENDL